MYPSDARSAFLPALPPGCGQPSGDLLFIADRTGGLLVFNVSLPSSPVLVSHLNLASGVYGVHIDGTLALLAALDQGLIIVDISDPSHLQTVSQTPFDSYDPFGFGALARNPALTVTEHDSIAFVGALNFDAGGIPNGTNGMVYGFDYRQPQHPRLVSLSAQADAIAGGITSVFVNGTDLFASGPLVGLIQLDIAQPRNVINMCYPPPGLRPAFSPPAPLPSVVAYSKAKQAMVVTKKLN